MEKKLIFDTSRSYIWGRLALLCCLFLTFFACVQDDVIVSKGLLNLQMNVDTTLTSSLSTKATSFSELKGFEDADSYKVVISQDSGVVAEYARFDKMPEELELKPGKYSLEVSKGTKSTAAFNSPYFSGKQDFTIVEEMTTPVEVTAALANSRVTVEFSDDFIETYKDYTLSFKTNKMSLPLVYEKGESRPMYFESDAAGTKLTIGMELVNVYGKDVQFNATTTIKPKQWSKLTIRTDEKGLNGVAIDVVLNDETKETVVVNIGIPDFMEQLKGAPSISSSFFNWEGNISMTEPYVLEPKDANSFELVPNISVLAGRRVSKAILSVSNGSESILNVDFANLGEGEKAELESLYAFGLPEVINGQIGFDFNPTGLLNSLKPNKDINAEYIISLSVTDVISQTTSMLVKVILNKPEAPMFEGLNAITGTLGKFEDSSSEQRNLTINYNSKLIDCSFELKNNETIISKGYVDFEANIVVGDDGNRIEGLIWNSIGKNATFSLNSAWLNTLDLGSYVLTVEIEDEAGYKLSHDISIDIAGFEWDTELGDLFAKYMYLRVKPAGLTSLDLSKLKFINKENQAIIATGADCETEATGVVYFVWKDLASGKNYQVVAEYDGVQISKEFSTEVEFQIPDGGFDEEWSKTVIPAKSVNVGSIGLVGQDIDVWYPYKNKDDAFWNTDNEITACCGTSKGTAFYKQYSGTERVDKKVQLTTIGWGESSTCVFSGWLGGPKHSPDNVTSGKLYAAEYIDGTWIEGQKITSRPSKLEFDYEYKAYGNDNFIVDVLLESVDGITIGTKGNLSLSEGKGIVSISYSDKRIKASRIKIRFESGSNNEFQAIRGNLDDWKGNADTRFVGSVLTIDNIKLVYDDYSE